MKKFCSKFLIKKIDSLLLFKVKTDIFEIPCGIFWADAGVGEPGRTVNPLASAFGGSNPSPPT